MEMEKSKESQLWLKLRALEPINANAKKKRHLYSCLMLAIHVCFIKSLINLEKTPKKSPTIINNMPWLHAYLQPKKQNQTAHFRLINEIPNGRGYAPFNVISVSVLAFIHASCSSFIQFAYKSIRKCLLRLETLFL